MSDVRKIFSKHKWALICMCVLSVAFVFVIGLIMGSRNPSIIQAGSTIAEQEQQAEVSSGDVKAAQLMDVKYNADHFVEGWVQAKNPENYQAILFIYTDQYYVKPDYLKGEGLELSEIQPDGRFLIKAYHDSEKAADQAASKFVIYLVEKGFDGVRNMSDVASAASVAVDRFEAEIKVGS